MNYLLESSVCLIVFFSFYYFLLRKNNFFGLQRIYLLLASLFSIVLPLIQIDWVSSSPDSLNYIIAKTLSFPTVNANNEAIESSSQFSALEFLYIIYIVGVFLMILKFVIGIGKLIRIIQNNEVVNRGGDRLIVSKDIYAISSFYKYIFLDPSLENDEELLTCVLTHERKHIEDGHFYDLVWFELLKICYWFNPIIYLYSYEIRKVHEYICDRKVLQHHSKNSYEKSLIKVLFMKSHLPLVSSLKEISIKNRLNMMNMKKSSNLEKIKFFTIVPLVMIMLLAFNPIKQVQSTRNFKGDKVYGKVTSENGKTLPGVKIIIDGEEKGITDLKGKYKIQVSKNSRLIEFVFPGFETLSEEIPENGLLHVTLKEGLIEAKKFVGDVYYPELEVIVELGKPYLVGKVKNKEGEPLENIMVLVPKQKIKTSTNEDGEFRLELKEKVGRAIFGIPNEENVYYEISVASFGND